MAPSAVLFEPSYTALKNLQHKVHKYTTTLAVRVAEVKRGVDRVDAKVDKVKTEVAEIKTEVAEIKTEVAEIKTEVAEIKTENSLFNQTQSLNNHTYIQLNSIQKWLDDQIEPIIAYVQDRDYYRYIVAKGFPNRVKDFWRLVLDPKTLTDLARHYSVRDWERWKRATLRDTDVSYYMELEDAVIAHPYKAQEDQDNNSITGSESTSLQEVESTSSQDVDDQGSQPSRVISVHIRVSSNTERRDLVERLMALKREDPGRRSHNDSPKLQNRMRHQDGRLVHTSELIGQHRDRSSRDRSPRGELTQSAPSTTIDPNLNDRP
ncbi:hypothetical protein V2W45_1470842 [Cenococcum geophilum]